MNVEDGETLKQGFGGAPLWQIQLGTGRKNGGQREGGRLLFIRVGVGVGASGREMTEV